MGHIKTDGNNFFSCSSFQKSPASQLIKEKSSCKCVVPCFPATFGYVSTYTCIEQLGSGLVVSWNEIGSISKEHDNLDSYHSEDLGRKLASQLLKLEISDNSTYGDLARATFMFNDLLLGNKKVPIMRFFKHPRI